mgnify:CR=1 FL=1
MITGAFRVEADGNRLERSKVVKVPVFLDEQRKADLGYFAELKKELQGSVGP